MSRPKGTKNKSVRKDKSAIPSAQRKAATCKRYEKTLRGFLMRTYRNMTSRVTGVQKLKAHIYKGLPILNKEDFYLWSLSESNFVTLFKEWKDTNFNRKLTPSIDRINNYDGYVKGNIRWITHSENSRLGTLSRFSSQIYTTIFRPLK